MVEASESQLNHSFFQLNFSLPKVTKERLNYTGAKTDRFEYLHSAIKAQIENRLPLYREAPACRLKRSIATSWSRFEEEFDAYLRGEEFPLLAPMKEEQCLD